MTSTAVPPTDQDALAPTAAVLRLAVGRLSRRMRQESSSGHSLTQIGILATLDRQGPTTLGALATTERVAPPTITKAVTTLAEAGLVAKVPDPDDRRVCRAELTPAGAAEVRAMQERRDAWLATRLATLDPSDVARLAELVPLIEALTDDETPSPTDTTTIRHRT